MAVPSYESLLDELNVNNSQMALTLSDDHLMKLSSIIDINTCEILARNLGLPKSVIDNIKSEVNPGTAKSLRFLEHWKQRRGSKATYEEVTKTLLSISRTDVAEQVVKLHLSASRDTTTPSSQMWDSSVAKLPSDLPSSELKSFCFFLFFFCFRSFVAAMWFNQDLFKQG